MNQHTLFNFYMVSIDPFLLFLEMFSITCFWTLYTSVISCMLSYTFNRSLQLTIGADIYVILVSGLKSNYWGQCTDGKPHFFKPQELPQQPVVVGIIVLHLHPVLCSLSRKIWSPRWRNMVRWTNGLLHNGTLSCQSSTCNSPQRFFRCRLHFLEPCTTESLFYEIVIFWYFSKSIKFFFRNTEGYNEGSGI